jgi:hypothetical protein
MPFIKGDKKINRQGRKPGKPNRSTEQIRNMIADFIEANLEDIQSEYDQLEGKDKIILLERMLKHYLPPPPPENLLEGFSDMDLDILITHLRKKMN